MKGKTRELGNPAWNIVAQVLLSDFRKAITLAHQCQITQLKENFKEKLKLSENLPDKFASDLEKEREKHQKQLQQLESSLKENFKIVS